MKLIITLTALMLLLLAAVVSADDVCVDDSAPTVPPNLAIADSPYDVDGNVTLSWGASSDSPECSAGVDHYNVYRSTDGENFTKVAEITGLSFNQLGLTNGVTYYYRVTAVDSVVLMPHESDYSTVSTTIGTAPPPPQQPSSSSSSSSSSGGGGGGPALATTDEEEDDTSECTPSWDCTEWSECADGTQTKTCTDTNECGTSEGKPAEEQDCEMTGGSGEGSDLQATSGNESDALEPVKGKTGLAGITGAIVGAGTAIVENFWIPLAILGSILALLIFLYFRKR